MPRVLLATTLVMSGLVSLSSLVEPTLAADRAELERLLKQEIVGSTLPLAETQAYCTARVPKTPTFDSAAEWQLQADRLRAAVLENVVYRGEAANWRDAETRVEWLDTIDGGPGYRIKKLRFEALPGLWIPALLYVPEELEGKVPVVLNVNGHSAEGKAYVPKQLRCINQAKRGILALNVEWVGMGQLRGEGFVHYRMNQLDLCGTSGLAPFYLSMKRSLDLLLNLEHADPQRVAVTGLSGGGWQTITISSLDTRVTLCNPVAGYSSLITRAHHLKDLGDSEQTPCDLATLVDYTTLTAMMAPRPTLLTYNFADNCCFESVYALQPLLDAAQPAFRLFDCEEALRSHVNRDPGTHNYERDNREAFYRMLGDFFYAGDESFNVEEIPSEEEVKTAEQLFVPMPERNEDFHTLATTLSKSLPRGAELPREKTAALTWARAQRTRLGEVVRFKDYDVTAMQVDTEDADEVTAVFWRLQMGGDWTVPALELAPKDPSGATLLVLDGGRAAGVDQVARLLEAGQRVLAVDPSNLGETVTPRSGLFPLLVSAVGERPLGIQAGQLAAVARWWETRHDGQVVTLTAVGPRATTAALVAAALEPKAIGRLELHDSLASLKQVIENNWDVNRCPELFCFGLLEAFDVKQLVALAAPRPVQFVGPSERHVEELAELAAFYGMLGAPFNPVE